ncbi:MAG: hypothetical protein JW754_01510 [Candidatus Aenigmarchaeota archaeon]|nr:hypothetical protein [Candidatus Aenigmarchaeota archaeon]
MDFRWAAILGVVLAVVVISVSSFVWMFSVALVSPVAMVLVIILSLAFGWIYFGKDESNVKTAVALGILWIIIAVIIEAIVMVGLLQQFDYFIVNPSVYAGYLLIMVFTVAAFFLKKRLSKESAAQGKPTEEEATKEIAMRGDVLLEPSIAS